ncbi:unnamed protein product [Arabis nemorensis]|uniref:Acidic protein n=1 Tax=Arabis nemorensis TaxID=586526 RepID=A0A565CJV3_9BRAS|nr:unnamed protein product [Arabis nemorensis]
MAVLVVMMLTIAKLVVESEAIKITFPLCYLCCLEACLINPLFPKKSKCSGHCASECKNHLSEMKLNEIDQINDFCQVGCVTHRCVSVKDQNMEVDVEKVANCEFMFGPCYN